MSVSKHIPENIKRASKAVGYAIWLDETDYWLGLPVVLMARLTTRQRAALAFATLKSLDHSTASAAATAALGGDAFGEVAA